MSKPHEPNFAQTCDKNLDTGWRWSRALNLTVKVYAWQRFFYSFNDAIIKYSAGPIVVKEQSLSSSFSMYLSLPLVFLSLLWFPWYFPTFSDFRRHSLWLLKWTTILGLNFSKGGGGKGACLTNSYPSRWSLLFIIGSLVGSHELAVATPYSRL